MGYRYTVRASFEDPQVACEWIEWLAGGHCREVIEGGATRAEVFRHDGTEPTVEVRYDFPDRATFEAYEQRHAPRLREEGLLRFPVERGIAYQRSCGEVVHSED